MQDYCLVTTAIWLSWVYPYFSFNIKCQKVINHYLVNERSKQNVWNSLDNLPEHQRVGEEIIDFLTVLFTVN